MKFAQSKYSRPTVCMAALAATLTIALLLGGCASPSGLAMRDVGSFHIGGKKVTLSGLPEKELRFTPTAPPIKVNPNCEFEAEQMYVQYVTLAAPKAKCPLLMWHGGGLGG